MKVLKLFILLILIPCVSLWAQQDTDAEPFLDNISKDLDPGYSLKIEFDYSREDLQTGSIVEGDGILYLLGDKYKLEMEEFVIFYDGEKQYSLNLEVEEVYISIPDPENKEFMFSDPITLLRKYKEEFKYRIIGEASIRGVSTTEIQLYPMELGGPYALLKLYIEPNNSKLKAIRIRHKKGILYSMFVSGINHVEALENSFFQFNVTAYPNVDVIELVQ